MMRLAVLLCVATAASALSLDEFIDGRQTWVENARENPQDVINAAAIAGVTGFTFFTINDNTPTVNLEYIKDLMALIYWVATLADPGTRIRGILPELKKVLLGVAFLGDQPVESVEQIRSSYNQNDRYMDGLSTVNVLAWRVLQWRLDGDLRDRGWTPEPSDDESDARSYESYPGCCEEYYDENCTQCEGVGAPRCPFCTAAHKRILAWRERAERKQRDGDPPGYDSEEYERHRAPYFWEV